MKTTMRDVIRIRRDNKKQQGAKHENNKVQGVKTSRCKA
jgi:hypothetical protein